MHKVMWFYKVQQIPLPVWRFHLWNLDLWRMTDGAIRVMPPIISPGFFHSSVLHILSEAGVGMDLIMSWNLHTQVAKGTAYFCPWSFIGFISRKKVKGYQPQKINWSSTLKSSVCSQDSTFHISNAYSVWRFRKIFFILKKIKLIHC